MNTPNITLMQEARRSLEGKWGFAIGAFLIYTLLTSSLGAYPVGFISLLIAGPMSLGAAYISLGLSRGNEMQLEQLFDGFRLFSKALVAYLLILLYVVLRLLLLIIPGIIAALSYSMSFYILADHPSLTPQQALKRSQQMMYGNKEKLFGLFMRFLLLSLLCILTLGIGFLWLIPYANVTMAKFYDDIKNGVAGE